MSSSIRWVLFMEFSCVSFFFISSIYQWFKDNWSAGNLLLISLVPINAIYQTKPSVIILDSHLLMLRLVLILVWYTCLSAFVVKRLKWLFIDLQNGLIDWLYLTKCFNEFFQLSGIVFILITGSLVLPLRCCPLCYKKKLLRESSVLVCTNILYICKYFFFPLKPWWSSNVICCLSKWTIWKAVIFVLSLSTT